MNSAPNTAVQGVAHLEKSLGVRIVTDPAVLQNYRTDRSGQHGTGLPLAVVFAENIDDVVAVCKTATAHNIPLVTRGAGSGLSGGTIASEGELVLSLERMTEILEVSATNRSARVQAGILNGDLNRELAKQGLWWAPDPASKDISSVGGNIAMNAGGLLCAKYGVTREAVLGLKIVLIDGRIIEVGHNTIKGVAGYDLTALMIGSEGTLGIIVEAVLKLRPAITGTTPTLAAEFPSVHACTQAVEAIIAAGVQPAALEMMDKPSFEAVKAYSGRDFVSAEAEAFLLAQTDGGQAEVELAEIDQIMRAQGAKTTVATTQEEAEELFALRRLMFPSLEATGTLLVEDVAVPISRLTEAFARIRQIEEKFGIRIPTAAHAGDGNLHPTFVVDGDEIPDVVWEAASELFQIGLELGGTLTGEHGIGLLKRRWLKDELGDDQYALQQAIKQVFDPNNLLNPGKVFSD